MSCLLPVPRHGGSHTAREGWPVAGTSLPGPLLRLGLAEGHAGEEPERLGYFCSPASVATVGDDGDSLFPLTRDRRDSRTAEGASYQHCIYLFMSLLVHSSPDAWPLAFPEVSEP